MKRTRISVSTFLAGLAIGVFGSTALTAIAATTQVREIERHYEQALHSSFAAFDRLFEVCRQ